MRKFKSRLLAAACGIVLGVGALGMTDISAAEFKESKTFWIIGDSIASDHADEDNLTQNKVPITGWGNVLKNFLSSDVTINNVAKSGRSSKSYTTESVYKDTMKKIGEGDYVFVCFGHNDEDESTKLHTDAEGDSATEGSFKWYIKTYYIEPSLEKGASVILASSVVRYTYDDAGNMADQTHAAYAEAMAELADEYANQESDGPQVYFVDTYNITLKEYTNIGMDAAADLHAVLGLDAEATMDTTHYGPYGAVWMASTMAKEFKALGLECCQDATGMQKADTDSDNLAKNRAAADKFSWSK